MKETFTWKSETGNEFKLEAECEVTMKNIVHNLDGDVFISDKKEESISANLVVYVNGEKIESCWNTDAWRIINANANGQPLKRISGISKIAFKSDIAEEISKFLKSVIENGKSNEVKAFEAVEKDKEIKEEIEEIKEIIAKCELQKEIPTKEEAKRRMNEYNRINNEGGEGYVPYVYNIEQYQNAKSRLDTLLNK